MALLRYAPQVIYGDRNSFADGEQGLRKVTVPEKIVRPALLARFAPIYMAAGLALGAI